MAGTTERLAALAAATLQRHPELSVGHTEAFAALHERAAADLAGAQEVRTLDGGRRACVVLTRLNTRFQDDAQRCRIEVAMHDGEAYEWVAAQMRELSPRFDVTFELLLDVGHRGLMSELRSCGLTPRMQILHGAPATALAGLRAGPMNREALGNALRIEALAQPEHVEPIVTLLRAFFERRPEAGHISLHVPLTVALQSRLDAHTRSALQDALGNETAFVVLRDDEVMGYGQYQPRHDPIYGHVGGMVLGFAESIQGRGIGKLVYERLLESMVTRGVRMMKGRTANPAVIHLAPRMKRPLRGWQFDPATAARKR